MFFLADGLRRFFPTHRHAVITISLALVLDAVCGTLFARFEHIPDWHGLYCALANAVTVGGDVSPSVPLAYAVNAVECALVVPLFAATLSLFTTSMTTERVMTHVSVSEKRIKRHITAQVCGPDGQPDVPEG